jgi:DnaJ-class molecular chaperone
LHFKVVVEVPKSLNGSQKDALRKFADLCGKTNYSRREKFFSKIFGKDNK